MVLKCAAVSESESERFVDAPRPDSKSQKLSGIYDGPQVYLLSSEEEFRLSI